MYIHDANCFITHFLNFLLKLIDFFIFSTRTHKLVSFYYYRVKIKVFFFLLRRIAFTTWQLSGIVYRHSKFGSASSDCGLFSGLQGGVSTFACERLCLRVAQTTWKGRSHLHCAMLLAVRVLSFCCGVQSWWVDNVPQHLTTNESCWVMLSFIWYCLLRWRWF